MSSYSNQNNNNQNMNLNNNYEDSQLMKNNTIDYEKDINFKKNDIWFNSNNNKNQNNNKILNNATEYNPHKVNQLFNKDNNKKYDNNNFNSNTVKINKNFNNQNNLNTNKIQLNHDNDNGITKMFYENYEKVNHHKYLRNKSHKPNLSGSYFCSISQYSQVIDRNESNIIKNIVEIYYTTFGRSEDEQQNENKSLSSLISSQIKNKLGGEWFVFVSKKNDNLYFNISSINESDILVIDIGESIFRIAKTK